MQGTVHFLDASVARELFSIKVAATALDSYNYPIPSLHSKSHCCGSSQITGFIRITTAPPYAADHPVWGEW